MAFKYLETLNKKGAKIGKPFKLDFTKKDVTPIKFFSHDLMGKKIIKHTAEGDVYYLKLKLHSTKETIIYVHF